MLDRKKVMEFFDGESVGERINIVGCGAIGSHVAEELARMGCINIHLWDFDTVSPHNITNQMFKEADIGRPKVDAVFDMMCEINGELSEKVTKHNCAVEAPWILNGYIFLCVDSIDVRREIVKANSMNPNAVAVFDFRMRLTDAQHYCADMQNVSEVEKLLTTMNFTQEEAEEATPKSACGTELSVIYTVKAIVSIGVCNFVRFVNGLQYKTVALLDMNMFALDAF